MGKRPRKKQSPLGKRRRRHEKADGSLANVLGVIREGTARIPILKELVGKLDADDSLALDEAVLRQLNRIAKRLQTQGKETHESLEGLEAQVGEVLEFLRARDDALTPADILRPHALTLGLAKSPAALLHARYQVVPFLEDLRVRELAELDSWCSGEGPTGVRLFVGQGGSGKTRLFVEWASRLRERGWHAGFLPDAPLDADVKVLLSSSEPVFAVLDYAESKPDLCELLRRVTARRARGASPLRIALVAREVADWWTSLIQRDSDVGNLLSQ